MPRHHVTVKVLGPWSWATSRAFWEGFAPATLADQGEQQRDVEQLRTAFPVGATGAGPRWSRPNGVTRHTSP